MKKVATTENGNILIEMTPDEWKSLNETGKGEVAPDNTIAWKKSFRDGVACLNLATRTRMRLERTAGIFYGDLNPLPHTKINEHVFKRNGKLLPFDTWCKSVLAGDINWMLVDQFGPKMQLELEEAIRRYLLNDGALDLTVFPERPHPPGGPVHSIIPEGAAVKTWRFAPPDQATGDGKP